MLTTNQIEKILDTLSSQGYFPEIEKCISLKNEIIEEIREFIFSQLTEEEKAVISEYNGDYPMSSFQHMERINVSSIKTEIDGKKSVINLYYDYNSSIKSNPNIGSRILYIQKNDKEIVPKIFNDIDDLEKKYPEEYEKVRKLIEEYIINTNSYFYKKEKIVNILKTYKDSNLSNLKQYYPELYNILKS